MKENLPDYFRSALLNELMKPSVAVLWLVTDPSTPRRKIENGAKGLLKMAGLA